jgi:hypothetical protein
MNQIIFQIAVVGTVKKGVVHGRNVMRYIDKILISTTVHKIYLNYENTSYVK